MTEIYDILSDLGIGRRYIGRNYLALGIHITMSDENYFFGVTKNLYPDIAKYYGTTWNCVERDMRTAIGACWRTRRDYLEKLAGPPLQRIPKPVDFIDIIVTYLLRKHQQDTAPV